MRGVVYFIIVAFKMTAKFFPRLSICRTSFRPKQIIGNQICFNSNIRQIAVAEKICPTGFAEYGMIIMP